MAVVDTHPSIPAPLMPRLVPTGRSAEATAPDTPRIVHARSEDGLLTWSYTAGLRAAHHHPEFLLTGLDPFLAESVLCHLVEHVTQGRVITSGALERDLLHHLTCAFCEVPGAMASVLMPVADTIEHGQSISALQCVYPDNKNCLPWHAGYNNSWHDAQPIFNFFAPLTRIEITFLQAAAGIHISPAEHTIQQIVPEHAEQIGR